MNPSMPIVVRVFWGDGCPLLDIPVTRSSSDPTHASGLSTILADAKASAAAILPYSPDRLRFDVLLGTSHHAPS